jgi:ribonuclease HI
LGYEAALMPWRTALLRGTKVFARCNAAGALLEQQGKVEIRYRQGDAKAYQALGRNLLLVEGGEIFPDEHCGAASRDAPEQTSAASARSTATASRTRGPAKKAASKSDGAAVSAPIHGEHVIAYTDGACSGNPGPAGLGVVMLQGDERSELSEYLGVGTNNIAELTAILRALEAMETDKPLFVHTDSQYAIGVLTKNWKPKANQELIQRIKQRMQTVRQLRLVYVPGHAGVPLNERADALARAAVAARASSGWRRARELDGAGV